MDYATLLLILHIHGFSAVEQGGYVQVIPDANVRQMPLPLVTGKESYSDGEYVNRIIVVKNAPAAQLVPTSAAVVAAVRASGCVPVQEHAADGGHVRQCEAHRTDRARVGYG